MRKKQGFTIIETIATFAIFFILIAIILTGFFSLKKRLNLSNAGEKVASALRIAVSKAVSSQEASSFGVYFFDSDYTLFKGDSYASRDASYDIDYILPSKVVFQEINLGGGNEVVFRKNTGLAANYGNIKLSEESESIIVYINQLGSVSFSGSSSFSLDNLVKDSRHVHFDLGWSMQPAVSLKFYFPLFSRTETVAVANYFNADKSDFDWEGEFLVGSNIQKFRVHTHLLDSIYTQLSISRDRNNNKNDQEVIIYINQAGIDREIAHYSEGQVIKGQYSQTMEIQ